MRIETFALKVAAEGCLSAIRVLFQQGAKHRGHFQGTFY
jgi:hypothetical protein